MSAAVERVLAATGISASPVGEPLVLEIDEIDAQAYRLEVDAHDIRLSGGSEAALFWGLQTLAQWWTAADGDEAACAVVEDRPDFAHRGVMLDVSRGRVPRLERLLALVDLLASWKINQLQLYTEHTFAYRGHELVWRDWSPFTGAEIERLDDHCHERFIELVPNQNSFGHMHRWLVHEPYRSLAECPGGIEHPFSLEREPFSLCPTDPGSLDLIDDLFGQLLPHFRSRLFNVGLDETFDLGRGRSQALCEERGPEEVYLDYLLEIQTRVAASGHRMLFWGDILIERPDLVRRLPPDVVPLLWGYHAGHPFGDQCAVLESCGLDFYVCPGTSTWNSFSGRLSNALLNLEEAAAAGRRHGAAGFLVTDWGDNGHLQPPSISLPALLAAASQAWNGDVAVSTPDFDLPSRLEAWALRGSALGAALCAAGDLYRQAGRILRNSSVLFNLLVFADRPLAERHCEDLDPATVERAARSARHLRAEVAATGDAREDIRDELLWALRATELGARIGTARLATADGDLTSLGESHRRELAAAVSALAREHRRLWLRTSRPGGLDYSAGYLERIAARLT